METPGEELKKYEKDEDEELLEEGRSTIFRKIAARCNYISADRPDIMYSVKEVCRGMAKPTVGGWKKLKRIGRYLIGKTRASISYKWQGREEEIDGYTDSDWAGCRATGKSTSGGVLMIGGNFIKVWSKTQNSIALSSAEAELIAMAKLSAEALGLISLARDLGEEKIGKVTPVQQLP